MGVSINGGYPKLWMVFVREKTIYKLMIKLVVPRAIRKPPDCEIQPCGRPKHGQLGLPDIPISPSNVVVCSQFSQAALERVLGEPVLQLEAPHGPVFFSWMNYSHLTMW